MINKVFIPGLFLLLLSNSSNAQIAALKSANSLRLGVEYTKLDKPDASALHYRLYYTRRLARDRIALSVSLGYMNVKNNRLLANDFRFEGQPRQRVTTDLTISFDLLSSTRNSLRIGLGPSLWYRKDDTFLQANYKLLPNGQLTDLVIKHDQIDELNFGYHFMIDYEYLITREISLGTRIGVYSLNEAGLSPSVGLTVGYGF